VSSSRFSRLGVLRPDVEGGDPGSVGGGGVTVSRWPMATTPVGPSSRVALSAGMQRSVLGAPGNTEELLGAGLP
jgi:hypothetical protein